MALAQDQAQASQAQKVLDERQYQKDVIQYGKDKAVYDKEKAAYDLQIKKIKDAETAEKKRLDEFIKMWRSHFIENNDAKYLPDGWRIDHKLERNFGKDSVFGNRKIRKNYEFSR